MNTAVFSPGQIVRPRGNDPRRAFFKIISISNGWLRCTVDRYWDGQRPSIDWTKSDLKAGFRFRTREMEVPS